MLLLRIGSFTASTGCINVTEQVLQQLKTLTLHVSLKGGEKKSKILHLGRSMSRTSIEVSLPPFSGIFSTQKFKLKS